MEAEREIESNFENEPRHQTPNRFFGLAKKRPSTDRAGSALESDSRYYFGLGESRIELGQGRGVVVGRRQRALGVAEAARAIRMWNGTEARFKLMVGEVEDPVIDDASDYVPTCLVDVAAASR